MHKASKVSKQREIQLHNYLNVSLDNKMTLIKIAVLPPKASTNDSVASTFLEITENDLITGLEMEQNEYEVDYFLQYKVAAYLL